MKTYEEALRDCPDLDARLERIYTLLERLGREKREREADKAATVKKAA